MCISGGTPGVRYFVGKLKKVRQGSLFRVLRAGVIGKGLFERTIIAMENNKGWKKLKVGYSKVSNYTKSRYDARLDKWALQMR